MVAVQTRQAEMFLAITQLPAWGFTTLRKRDGAHGEHVLSRAMVMQQKTQWPVQFEITE